MNSPKLTALSTRSLPHIRRSQLHAHCFKPLRLSMRPSNCQPFYVSCLAVRQISPQSAYNFLDFRPQIRGQPLKFLCKCVRLAGHHTADRKSLAISWPPARMIGDLCVGRVIVCSWALCSMRVYSCCCCMSMCVCVCV